VSPARMGMVSRKLRLRESLHRRLLLLAALALLLLTTVPIVAHHLPIPFGDPLARVQHIGGICLAALSAILTTVHYAFHVVLALGLSYAVWDRVRAASLLRSVLAELDSRCPSEGHAVWAAARAAGVDPVIVRVVPGLPNPAFTAGAFSPRIYIASDLACRLTSDQLALVLAHEAAHVRRRDPLRLSIYRFLSFTFFWIPALRRLSDDIADEAEIEADDAAGERDPLVLASAILRLAYYRSSRTVPLAVGFQNPDLLNRRIRRLAGEETTLPTRLTRLSIAGACLSITLVFASGLAAELGPGGPEHCRHPHGLPFSHLFCHGATSRDHGSDCIYSAV
jgi:Zn-dependent protease with chaperone function